MLRAKCDGKETGLLCRIVTVEMERHCGFVQVHNREVPLGSHLLCFQSPTVTEKDVVRIRRRSIVSAIVPKTAMS